jgi:hypothetical protein
MQTIEEFFCFVSIVKRGATVIIHFWVTPKFVFILFKKKEKKTTRNSVVLALFSFFPAHAEAGKKKILNLCFSLFSFSLSPPHLPKKPARPIPTQLYPASIMEEK